MPEDNDRTLVMLIEGQRAGVVTMDLGGRFTLNYHDYRLAAKDPTPASLSMPLATHEHGDRPVRAFLLGLLPDNERVLERWAATYHVSAGNPFALLRHVGEDCAGAVQFVTPERVDALLAGDGGVHWLNDADVAERLRILRADPTAWHVHNSGQFSLAGAQAKTALHFDQSRKRWGEPWGAVPTTHILKPAVTGFDDHDLNEHLCLRALALLGLPAAASRVESFGGERVIVVERYDRRWNADGSVTRVHQEDMCQALAAQPSAKYQQQGGPTPETIIALLRKSIGPSRPEATTVQRFVEALAFNWIVGGTDAHAKNYSVLLAGSQVRLAPSYDVASTIVYEGMYEPKLEMAMKIGGRYGIEAVHGRHWRRFAVTNRLDPDGLIHRIDNLAARAPAAFEAAAEDNAVRRIESQLPQRLVERVAARAQWCRDALLR